MLQQFSWSHFLIAAAIFTFLWYLFLVLTVYRRDCLEYLSGSKTREPSQADKSLFMEVESTAHGEAELMGKSRLPDGLEIVSIGQLNFGSPDQSNQEDGRLGLLPDVMQEFKEIFATLASEDGKKQDFLALASIVREKYGSIAGHPNIAQINEFIRERAPFALSNDELEDIWS